MAYLSDKNPIGAHPQGFLDQLAHVDLTVTFKVSLPGLHAHHVAQIDLEHDANVTTQVRRVTSRAKKNPRNGWNRSGVWKPSRKDDLMTQPTRRSFNAALLARTKFPAVVTGHKPASLPEAMPVYAELTAEGAWNLHAWVDASKNRPADFVLVDADARLFRVTTEATR